MSKTPRRPLKWLKKKTSGNLLPFLIYCFMRALYATLRVIKIGEETPEPFYRKGQGIIFAFWHGMMLPAAFFYKGNGAHILVSRHGDGELIGNVIKRFGFFTVKGSSSRGGREALFDLQGLLLENKDVAVTPDGPRGPAECLKPGIAQLARVTGAPIISMAYSGTSLKILKTWDRFRIPMPFSKIVAVCGEPIYYQEGEDFEAFRTRIEEYMRELTLRADSYYRKDGPVSG